MITVAQLGKLGKKFKHLQIMPVSTVAGIADNARAELVNVLCIKYQKNGITPGKMSDGLIEANAMWDTRKSRPPGYTLVWADEQDNGHCTCIMVSEDWLEFNSIDAYVEGWKAL
jgi:hypothetical protein